MCFLAGFYNETIKLNISTSTRPLRIECRAFLTVSPEVPCCDDSNHNSLCQPDTGIARFVVDIVGSSDPTASTLCKAGVDLNSLLPLNDTCPANGQPKYCKLNGANDTQTQHLERGDLKIVYKYIRDCPKVATNLDESKLAIMKILLKSLYKSVSKLSLLFLQNGYSCIVFGFIHLFRLFTLFSILFILRSYTARITLLFHYRLYTLLLVKFFLL